MAADCTEALDYDPEKVSRFLQDYEERLNAAKADDDILSGGERNVAFLETALNSPIIQETLEKPELTALKLQLEGQKAALDYPLTQEPVSIEDALTEARQLLTAPDVREQGCSKGASL